MPSIGDITGRIVIVDKGSPALTQFESNIKGSIKTIEVAGGRLTATLDGMLSKAALLATAGMIARTGFQFLKEAGQEAIEAEKAFAQLRAGVQSTGGAAGKSAEELSALADELSKLTGFDDELIAGGEAILLTFRRVRGEAFEQTMSLALDLSARFGKDIDSSVTMIAKALDMLMAGSAKGLSALSKAGVTFTDSQKKMMEELVRTGQAAEAQRLFFKELEAQFGGSAVAARDTLGGALGALGIAWANLKEAIGTSGSGIRIVIEGMITLVERFTLVWQKADLGISIVLLGLNVMIGGLENKLQSLLVTALSVSNRLTQANPFASDEQKIKAQIGLNNAIIDQHRKRNVFAERSRNLEAEIAQKTMALLGILPKVQGGYSDIADEIEGAKSKQQQWFDDLFANLARQEQALSLLRQGMPTDEIERLVEAAEALGKTNLLDPLVLKAGVIKARIDAIAAAFKLADEAKKKFAEAGDDLDELIKKQFESFGGNDPEMVKLIATLREAKSLTASIKTDEQKRLEIVGRAQQLYEDGFITAIELQAILLANADQWNMDLDETQIRFNEIYERLSDIAEGIAYDLVSNWRTAWEENESIVDATVDTLRDSFLNVLQDIISQWLSQWFKAMAAWLARWIATQAAAKGAQAGLGSVSGGSSAGSAAGAAGAAAGSGVSANTLYGWALAAFAIYVVYKGFVERERKKFAQVTIEGGQYKITASRGQKYLDGVSQAAEMIVKNVTDFLDAIDVTMTRMGTVIIESSKSGWNVSIPGSTGKLFSSMEEAISYAQVLMLKYGEFADSVSTLVKGVITSTKAISIEQLAGDLDWARMLETQNLEQAALDVSNAMDVAIANWKRAEEMFLSFYSVNLPAFEAAIDSILTKLGSDLINVYNRLAGIEEDPEKAWQRQKAAYNAQRLLVLAQLKLWQLEIAARIANYNAQRKILGGNPEGPTGPGKDGGGGAGGGLIGIAAKSLMVASILADAAGILDPALQDLYDIQALITQAINETPPELTDADYPGKGRKGGGGKNRKEMRADIRDELESLEAEAKGSLHAAFNDLNNNIAAFREKAKEAKLPAAELARGVELMTEAFRRSVQQQARDYAGLNTGLAARVREVEDFFTELAALGQDATGMTGTEVYALRARALQELGTEILAMVDEFAGLSDPMTAINARANELREGVLAFAEAAGWSAEQIDEALRNIEKGIDLQRAQGINSVLGNLFGILKQAGLYAAEALEFDRQSTLLQLEIIEAQLRFYSALTEQTQEWIDAARRFVLSDRFGKDGNGPLTDDNDVVRVRVVNATNDWDDIVDRIKDLVESWRDAVQQFADSTASLMTDEELTNLTQEQQLAFAKAQVEDLAARAAGGDVEALAKLEEARAEYLRELRESEGGGFGFDKGWDWVMNLSADLLANAQAAEDALIAKELAKTIDAWAYVMDKLGEQLEAAFYSNTQDLIDAIYVAIGGYGSGSNFGFGANIASLNSRSIPSIGSYIPEAMVPIDRLAGMVPYSRSLPYGDARGQGKDAGAPIKYDFFKDPVRRLERIEELNRRSTAALGSMRSDINSIARKQ